MYVRIQVGISMILCAHYIIALSQACNFKKLEAGLAWDETVCNHVSAVLQ